MATLCEANKGNNGAVYVNYENKFQITDSNGKATDGKRIVLTSKDGIPKVNITEGIAEAKQRIKLAEEAGADTCNFSFTIERTDTGKPDSRIAKLISRGKVRGGTLVTRFGGFWYKSQK